MGIDNIRNENKHSETFTKAALSEWILGCIKLMCIRDNKTVPLMGHDTLYLSKFYEGNYEPPMWLTLLMLRPEWKLPESPRDDMTYHDMLETILSSMLPKSEKEG